MIYGGGEKFRCLIVAEAAYVTESKWTSGGGGRGLTRGESGRKEVGATGTGALAQGDVVEVNLAVSRRAVVQIVRAAGRGNGSLSNANEYSAVVRGSWRVRFRASAWSRTLSTQATAREVHAALDELGTLGAVVVDRRTNTAQSGARRRLGMVRPIPRLRHRQGRARRAARAAAVRGGRDARLHDGRAGELHRGQDLGRGC